MSSKCFVVLFKMEYEHQLGQERCCLIFLCVFILFPIVLKIQRGASSVTPPPNERWWPPNTALDSDRKAAHPSPPPCAPHRCPHTANFALSTLTRSNGHYINNLNSCSFEGYYLYKHVLIFCLIIFYPSIHKITIIFLFKIKKNKISG